MKNKENQEIGELIAEIVSANAQISIHENNSPAFVAVLRGSDFGLYPHGVAFTGGNIPAALRQAANWVRKYRGEPPLADPSELPTVETGDDASCACGSRRALIVELGTAQAFIPWNRSRTLGRVQCHGQNLSYGSKVESFAKIQPGEIGTCVDCGKQYRFGA
jgi:hypothetical protein